MFDESCQTVLSSAKIKVLGVGGAGNNTVNSMLHREYDSGVEFIVANTDSQALNASDAPTKIQLGVKLTKGLGSGANPTIGKRAAEEDLDKIVGVLQDADIVFLAGGMGGGTGSGAMPVIARALRERGILTIALVTRPFTFEGRRRAAIAQEATAELQRSVDTLIVIPNQKLLESVNEQMSMIQAFEMINDILYQSVKGIAYIMTKSGHINVDFADLRAIMKDMGKAVMGTGRASGPERAIAATKAAISSPLLENIDISGARGVLINVSGGASLSLHELNQAAGAVYELVDAEANIILGSVIDPTMGDDVIVTIIATGCGHKDEIAAGAAQKVVQAASETVKASVVDQSVQVTPYIAPGAIIEADPLDVPAFLRNETSV